MIIDWQRDKIFSKTEVTGETFCTYLRERLSKFKHFHHEDDKGRSYIDQIVDYFDPFDPDDPDEVVASWRQFVIGKDPRREGDRIHPLFEIDGGSIVNITTPFCHEAQPENPFFQLYIEGLWFKFVEDAIIPQFWHASKADILSEARRIAIEGTFDIICGVDISSLKEDAAGFLDTELMEKAKMNEKNAERHRAKVEFLNKVDRTLKINADRYEKIKRTIRRLKGQNDWLPQLDTGNLQDLDAMMSDYRSSGLNYWAWLEEQRRERNREKAERRKTWHAKHNESPEAKAAERREKKAEWARSARSAAAEKSKVDVVSLNTLTPEPVPTPSDCKQDFKVGMAVVKWRDGDAEDAKARVLPPTFAAELAALTLELTPEERVRLFSIKRTGSQDEAQDENPRISLLDTKSLAEFDHLNPREKPNRQTSNQATHTASRDRTPKQILERIECELAGTATLEAVKSLLSHLNEKGISSTINQNVRRFTF